jgi:hypothetical protein
VIGLDLFSTLAWTTLSIETAPEDNGVGALAVLWGDGDEFGPESERRVRQVLSLWRQSGSDRRIFCIGGARPSRAFNGALVLCRWLAEAGVPVEYLKAGTGSNDTVSNIMDVTSVAWSAGEARVVIVTSPMQTLRMRVFLTSETICPTFGWAPYRYFDARPPISIINLWVAAHKEWLGIASLIIPSDTRKEILLLLRG